MEISVGVNHCVFRLQVAIDYHVVVQIFYAQKEAAEIEAGRIITADVDLVEKFIEIPPFDIFEEEIDEVVVFGGSEQVRNEGVVARL